MHSATKAFVQRIHKQVFEVDGPDFDLLGMHSSMAQFCIKYNIAGKHDAVEQIANQMIEKVLPKYRPLTVRLTHSEQNNVTALDFMIRNISYSPIQDIDQNLMLPVKELSKEIIEEPTTLGFRVKIIV